MGNFNREDRSFSKNKSFRGNGGGFKPAFKFDATCAKCKSACQVPFKPLPGRPVYCSNCFSKPANGETARPSFTPSEHPRATHNPDQYKEQFAALNAKLDAILRVLNNTATPAAQPHVAKVVKEEEKEVVKTKTGTSKIKIGKKIINKKKK